MTGPNISNLASLGPEEYGDLLAALNAEPEAGPKRHRNFARKIKKNPEAKALIRRGCEVIIAAPEYRNWLIEAHLGLLAHRRNDRLALDFCDTVLSRDSDSDLKRKAVLLQVQSLIRLGEFEKAQAVIAEKLDRGDPSEPERTLLSWYAQRTGDIDESRSLFRRSNAKHIQTLRKPPGEIKPIKTAGPVKIYLTTNDEMELLPELLAHYRGLGRVQFVIVDNHSQDGTLEFLKDQDDVKLYHTEDSFNRSAFGCTWLNALVPRTSGTDELCIRIDADEFMVYSGMRNLSLNDYLLRAEAAGIDIVPGILIDMYPEDITYGPAGARPGESDGQRTLREAVYFDRSIHMRPDFAPPYQHHSGGVRPRVFGGGQTYLTKTPIFRGGGAVKYLNANHTTTPGRVAPFNCNLLHYKITPGSIARYETQLDRGEHYLAGARYRKFISLIRDGKVDMLSDMSVTYEGPETLENLGFLLPTLPYQDTPA